MTDLIIVGAGGMGCEVLEIIQRLNDVENKYNITGFIDDLHAEFKRPNFPYKILGSINGWEPAENQRFVMAIADPKVKEEKVNALKAKGAVFETIIANTAIVSQRAKIGEGVIISERCNVSIDTDIGDFVFFNNGADIGHDASIGVFSCLMNYATINGNVKAGKCVVLGTCASTYPGITIGDYATIGMNSCAIRSVKPHTTVIGVPAKTL